MIKKKKKGEKERKRKRMRNRSEQTWKQCGEGKGGGGEETDKMLKKMERIEAKIKWILGVEEMDNGN